MHLQARLFPRGAGSQRLIEAVVPPERRQLTSSRVAVPLADIAAVLHAGDGVEGFGVNGEAVFTAADLATVSHFELVCRKVLAESPRDTDANLARTRATPLREAGGQAPIRLVTGLTLSRVSLAPNGVGGIGDWTNEFAVGSAVAAALAAAGVTGYTFVPLLKGTSGLFHDHLWQIVSDQILPPAIIDVSVERISSRFAEEDGDQRHLGCLAYDGDSLSDRPDVTRTAEPWAGSHGWPAWVVSRRVVELLRRSQVRGWHYRPVLVVGGPLYERYLADWQALAVAVAASSRSQFEGGRW
jgi:hypothetical protein